MKLDDTTIKIFSLCEKIDIQAAAIYYKLSINEQDSELKGFWDYMSKQEKGHVNAWRFLIDLALKGEIQEIFDDPQEIMGSLEPLLANMNLYIDKVKKPIPIEEEFDIACNIELIMLDYSFVNAFYLIKSISDNKTTIDDYEHHLIDLIEKLDKYGCLSKLHILVAAIKRIWNDTKKLVTVTNEDYLTCVFNRRGFFHSLIPLAYIANRNKNPVGIMMIDLDKFKVINDTYGHQAGDKVLTIVSKSIKNSVRHSDIVGRFGGEEFIVFMAGLGLNNLYEIAEKIRTRIEEENKANIPITVSIGLAHKTMEGNVENEIDQLICKADENLYKAKASGRNRVVGHLLEV